MAMLMVAVLPERRDQAAWCYAGKDAGVKATCVEAEAAVAAWWRAVEPGADAVRAQGAPSVEAW